MAAYNEPQPSVNERGIPIVLSASTRSPRRKPLTPTRTVTPKRPDPQRAGRHAVDESQPRTPTKEKSIVDMHDSFSTACFHSHLKALSNTQDVSPGKRYPSQFTSPLRKPVFIKELPQVSKKERETKETGKEATTDIPKPAAPTPCTPSSQQQTALMATEDDIPDYNQHDHTAQEDKPPAFEHSAEKAARQQDKKMNEAETRGVDAKQDAGTNEEAEQGKVKPDEHAHTKDATQQQLKRKRESRQTKTSEELLKEEVLEIMDEFSTLGNYYQLIDKIGEGTFSSVYKAIDVRYEYYDNSSWDLNNICKDYERISLEQSETTVKDGHNENMRTDEPPKHYVALKRIYVTSSPQRITSEIEILHQLNGSECVVPLITAFRQMDQVMVIMPYFPHDDFRVFYRSMALEDIQSYFRCLFTALTHVHKNRILHRDIKPGNFLYNFKHRTGILVDFGLAQREDETRPSSPPPTTLSYRHHEASHSVLKSRQTNIPLSMMNEKENLRSSHFKEPQPAPIGYYRNDSRKPVRANRAGTRGFRAPEVLLRVVHQTVAIDIWAVGVILMSILTARFPFFQSEDDGDALIEVATVFGIKEVKECASTHNRTFHTNINTIPKTRISLLKLCYALNKDKADAWGEQNVRNAVDLLEKCLTLDCKRRITAEEALSHPFFASMNTSNE